MENKLVLEMKNISKSFPGVKALSDINFDVRVGETHALLGENGAGKSTLIKILAGLYKADEGFIYIHGQKVEICDVQSSQQLGISVIHQELCLAPNISVAANIFLAKETVKGPFRLIDNNKLNEDAQEILDRYGLNIRSEDSVGDLSVAQQQMVEIAKALSMDSRIIVMDEPTASLTDKEVIKLFESIRILKQKGVAIIYISHHIEELFEIADRVTIMRDGSYIGTKITSETSYKELVSMMVGRELKDMYPKTHSPVGKTIFEVKNLNCGRKVKNVSFSLLQGEILGFYGLVGSGRTELMRAIFGIDKPCTGEIFLDGQKVENEKPEDSISNGIVLVPESRKEQGLILTQGVDYNITLCILNQLIKGIRIKKELYDDIVDKYIHDLSIKTPSTKQLVKNLSGGNQQKIVIAKWLAKKPKVLILDEPTRGIDVGAKKEIYEIICRLVEEGVGVIMVSSELPEIVNMSTRVITMHEGKISGIISKEEISQENIALHATGGIKNAG